MSCCLAASSAARASTAHVKVSFRMNIFERVATVEMRAAPKHGRKNGLHTILQSGQCLSRFMQASNIRAVSLATQCLCSLSACRLSELCISRA